MALPAVPALPMGVAGKHWGRRGQWGPLIPAVAKLQPGLGCSGLSSTWSPRTPGQMVGLHKQPALTTARMPAMWKEFSIQPCPDPELPPSTIPTLLQTGTWRLEMFTPSLVC